MLPFLAALAPWAPVIGAGISAIGALLAPKPKPEKQVTKTETTVDLVKLRDEAIRAGFNPLTVMRAGGVMGFSYTNSTTRLPALPDMRLSNALGYLGAGVSAFSYDPFREERHSMDMRLGEAQIAMWNRMGIDSSGGGGAYSVSPSVSVPLTGGVSLDVAHPNLAQEAENHFGEIGGELFGIPNLVETLSRYSQNWFEENLFAPARAWKVGNFNNNLTSDIEAMREQMRLARGF